MKPPFKLLFFLYRAKMNSRGTAPIYCRITLGGKRKNFSTGFFINPNSWNTATNTVSDNTAMATEINNHLISIRSKALKISLKYQLDEEEYTLETLCNEILGKKTKSINTFLGVFKQHNIEMQNLIGKTHSIGTYKKFDSIYNQMKEFIKCTYQKDDILLSNIKLKFILDLEYYLHTEKSLKQISINKTTQRVKKIVKYAVSHEYLEKDPLLLHKAKSVSTEVVFLDHIELSNLENTPMSCERLTKIKDCFIFCCYTGLAFKEMEKLSSTHIIKGVDNKDWIKIKRQKTGKPLMIPLLPKAIEVLEKYNNNKDYSSGNKLLLPSITNQKFNQYLKEVATEVGIKKKLTHHIARKTFASTVLLYNDVPMEVVSELLGHSSIAITQNHYGKVVNKKLGQKMSELGEILKKK